MNLKISVVVTVLNEEKTLSGLLTALKRQTHLADEVIIVDGGSQDRTWKMLETATKDFHQLIIFSHPGNRSQGRNYGISHVSNQVIAITDAGCIPDAQWLEKLLAKYKESKAPVIAGYSTATPQTPLQSAIVPYVLVMPDKLNAATFLPATRSMLIEKRVWSTLGGFDERLSDNEDYAFAHKIKKLGISVAFSQEAVVGWLPRASLKSFIVMIFRFGRGDVAAGIIRPKVLLLFARYVMLFSLMAVLLSLNKFTELGIILLLGFLGYTGWAINKNFRYAKEGWYWLPVLQLVSDWAVMCGSLAGLVKRLNK